MSRQLHLTSGSIAPQLIQLCLPVLGANVLQQLYNIMNSQVVIHYIGDSAFAALGVGESVMNLYIYVITGACMGAGVLIAQFYGEENLPRLRRQLYVSAVLIGGCTLAAVLLGQLFLPQILRLIQTPQALMADVSAYLRVILSGMVFTFTYNYLAAALRAIGNTRAALYFLLISLGYNLAAAWLLVAVLKLGIMGTALATASAQLLSTLLCLLYIRRKLPFLTITRQDMCMDPVLIRRTSSYAAVAALQQSSLYLGKLLIQGAVNSISLTSSAPISAFTAANRIENFTQAFGISGCESIAIFVAQNEGAGHHKRALRGFARGGAMVIGMGLLFSLWMMLFSSPPVRPVPQQRGGGAAPVRLLSPDHRRVLLPLLYRTHLCGLVPGERPDEYHLYRHHPADCNPGSLHVSAGGRHGSGRGGPVHRPGLGAHCGVSGLCVPSGAPPGPPRRRLTAKRKCPRQAHERLPGAFLFPMGFVLCQPPR